MSTVSQRLWREAFSRAEPKYFAAMSDGVLALALEYARAVGYARAEAAILDEIQKRREAVASQGDTTT